MRACACNCVVVLHGYWVYVQRLTVGVCPPTPHIFACHLVSSRVCWRGSTWNGACRHPNHFTPRTNKLCCLFPFVCTYVCQVWSRWETLHLPTCDLILPGTCCAPLFLAVEEFHRRWVSLLRRSSVFGGGGDLRVAPYHACCLLFGHEAAQQ